MTETLKAEHYPECNDKCEGDSHFLVGDPLPVGFSAEWPHVLPVDDKGDNLGHETRIDCPVCQPVLGRDGPLDTPVVVHVEPNWPGADPSVGRMQ